HASAGTGSNIVNSINELQFGLSRTGVNIIFNLRLVWNNFSHQQCLFVNVQHALGTKLGEAYRA
ncbi:MAG: hypothetical protein ACTHW0_09505, partial [Psychrobacter sp.]